MILTENTPLIIRRNELLRIADDSSYAVHKRLSAEDEARSLSNRIMEKARLAASKFKVAVSDPSVEVPDKKNNEDTL